MNYSQFLEAINNVPSLHAVFEVIVDVPHLGLKAHDRVIHADGPQGNGMYDARRTKLDLAPAQVQFLGYAAYEDLSKAAMVEHPFLASRAPVTTQGNRLQIAEPEIVLGRNLQLTTQDGTPVEVSSLGVDKDGYTVDLQVCIVDDGRSNGSVLCKDPVFVAGVMAQLASIGYEGGPFGRSEMGMQSTLGVALAPDTAFVAWLIEEHGWKDLDVTQTEYGGA